MRKRINIQEVADFINAQSPETQVYIGCDSERLKDSGAWHADYIIAVVVHIDGKHGCKVFGEVVRERDYDQKKNKPRMRLMTEVYKASEMYLKLAPLIGEREIQVHLDINPSELYGSSCVVNEAIGYIRGTCNVVPKVKPQAWCASYVADRYKSFR